MEKDIILVDSENKTLDYTDKLLAHRSGLLHRAFSVFVYRRTAEGRLEHLLQQRAPNKYHSANLWSNACCGHPKSSQDGLGEVIMFAACQRLYTEIGLYCNKLNELGVEYYQAKVNEEMIEHEIDHIFTYEYRGETLTPNPDEVQALEWRESTMLLTEMLDKPQKFSIWFRIILPKIIANLTP